MTGLALARGLRLPVDYATKRGAVVARSGGGKTYTAAVLAEEMTDAGQPWYALDPTGAWWGLKSSASGKRAGLPVIVIGGAHADVPLDEHAGHAIAELVAGEPSFYVIDTSELPTRAAEIRFGTAFFERLYRVKSRNRAPLHGFWDEADLFAPQAKGPDETKLLHHAENVVRRGRLRGLGTTMITQRPAVLNKNVLSQIDVLIALRLGDPRDRKAISDWLEGTPDPEKRREVLDSLASLALGEAWVYGPGEDPPVYKRAQVRERRTFNSSASGAGTDEAVRLADVDLDAVRARLAATIEKAKAEDPKLLRRRIAELERQLRERPAAEAERVEVPVEVPVLTDDDRELLHQVAAIEAVVPLDDRERLERAAQLARDVLAALQPFKAAGTVPPPRPTPIPAGTAVRPPAPPQPRPQPPAGPVQPAKQRILDALAALEQIGVPQADRTQLAFFAQASPKSSGYANNLGALRSAGLIDYPGGGRVQLTPDGRAQADGGSAPSTVAEMHAYVARLLSPPKWRLVDALIAVYPDALDKAELADRAGASPSSSGFANNLGSLRSLGLIDYPAPGQVAALPVLFLEGSTP